MSRAVGREGLTTCRDAEQSRDRRGQGRSGVYVDNAGPSLLAKKSIEPMREEVEVHEALVEVESLCVAFANTREHYRP